jgi:hypothetical protein
LGSVAKTQAKRLCTRSFCCLLGLDRHSKELGNERRLTGAISMVLFDEIVDSCNTVGFFSLETAWRTVQGYEVIDNIQHVT